MKRAYNKGIIHSNIKISHNIFELKLEIDLWNRFGEDLGIPGQFYMLRGWEAKDPFLPRPISIANIEDNIITFLYEVRGKGTHIISKLVKGDTLELLGPLGNGFDLKLKGKVGIVSGGIGIAPLIYLSKKLDNNVDFYCGFRDEVYYTDIIEKRVDRLFISTEDGSQGHKGFVTELFDPHRYDLIFTCGPLPMIKNVIKICRDIVPVYCSMESRMACGIGACLGCTIKTTKGMERVCKDGPVFSSREVIFSD